MYVLCRVLAQALLVVATLASASAARAEGTGTGGLTATRSGNDLILSFPTESDQDYAIQGNVDLLMTWTDLQSEIPTDPANCAISGTQSGISTR